MSTTGTIDRPRSGGAREAVAPVRMRVLAATDLSEAADVVLAEAVALAARAHGVLGVLHVLDRPRRRAGDAAAFARIAASAAATLREHAARAGGHADEVFVEQGAAHEEILRRAAAFHADVVVVGAYGHVTARVVHRARCNVLVARTSEGPGGGGVVAAAEPAELAPGALGAAAEEAKRRGAPLEVVDAIGFLDVEAAWVVEMGTPGSHDPDVRMRDLARRRLAASVAAIGVDAECEVLDRPAARSIAHEARSIGADLVVVGQRDSFALATLAEKIARTAPCSVLVVRP